MHKGALLLSLIGRLSKWHEASGAQSNLLAEILRGVLGSGHLEN